MNPTTKRRNQCLFCTSRRCNVRICTPNLRDYDEVACDAHVRDLEKHADDTLKGGLRCQSTSTGYLKRGDPYPAAEANAEELMRLRQQLAALETQTLWVVGQTKNPEGTMWDFQGVFSSEQAAVAACKDASYFVGPTRINTEIPQESSIWPGAYFPKA